MWLICLIISLFNIIKTKALECVSVVNQKCMLRPKILDVNESVGEALYYPYNVQVNKCSGSCNNLDNPIEKLCVPNVIKGLNMKVYNFLTTLNETRNVLWHESCKYVCKLNSLVCNNKQIWNDDTCRCDCNEGYNLLKDTRGIQVLANVNVICSVNQVYTMMNNNDNNNDNNFYKIMAYVFIGLFLLAIICFCVFACFKWFKDKKLFKNKYADY